MTAERNTGAAHLERELEQTGLRALLDRRTDAISREFSNSVDWLLTGEEKK